MNMFAFHGHSVLTNKIKLCNLAKSSPALAEYIPTTFELPVDWIEMSKITKAQESNDMLWLSKVFNVSVFVFKVLFYVRHSQSTEVNKTRRKKK